jgi:hypothetical protein
VPVQRQEDVSCEDCHGGKPGARDSLNRFLSIQRHYRYIGIRGEPADTQAFFAVMDERVRDLSELWHTFDLPKIDSETRLVIDPLKTERAENP